MANHHRIDNETRLRILDAVDIVDVVSDFVSLKRRGANYIGLCPFHNERTPSFSVSKSRGICKCFSCGEGGSAVNFLMKLENMSYQEALRWLAKKYGIPIKEREVSDEERQQEAERESMMAINDFAMRHFEKTLTQTADGRDIGMTYFAERGINAQSVAKFHLGYSAERGNTLIKDALDNGFSQDFLLKTGLAARNDRGLYDRFRGRVIYPVFTLSGRVVAFGGRTLKSDKTIAKYVNSPESAIYSKSRELYGLFQARKAIGRTDKCILVEGYMDVISMHQSGIENVVASSGTSLTTDQIRLIHRFTPNITVIYDADPAGIKASLRGIDMILAEGMNVKVLSLPPGEDPDSFAQSHTTAEVESYIAENETDFITFKSRIMLAGTDNDPIARSRAITSILHSVAVVPDNISRQVFIETCARLFGMDDKMLSLQVAKYMADNADERYKREQQEEARRRFAELDAARAESATDSTGQNTTPDTAVADNTEPTSVRQTKNAHSVHGRDHRAFLEKFELEVMRYAVRYGMARLCDAVTDDGQTTTMTVLQYIDYVLTDGTIKFVCPGSTRLWQKAVAIAAKSWQADYDENENTIARTVAQKRAEGLEAIRQSAANLSEIAAREHALEADLEVLSATLRQNFVHGYLQKALCWDDDDLVRETATRLASDKFVLSKVHTKFAHVETEYERIADLMPRAVYELKDAMVQCQIIDTNEAIKRISTDGTLDDTQKAAQLEPLMQQLMQCNVQRREFAHFLGERIVQPLSKN